MRYGIAIWSYLQPDMSLLDHIEQFAQHIQSRPATEFYIITTDFDLPAVEALGRSDLLGQCPQRRPSPQRKRVIFLKLQPVTN